MDYVDLLPTHALQHLGRDEDAIILLNTKLRKCEKNEDYYIILRNTAHLYEYEAARNNLIEALNYFIDKRNSPFAEATIHNNMSVINIWHKDYFEAESNLKCAISTLKQLNSNEVFEPYCNESVLSILKQDYLKGYEYAKKAYDVCPRALPLDIIMLTNNLTIAEICIGYKTLQEGLAALRNLNQDYQMIEDPWYEFQLVYNIKQIEHALYGNSIIFAENQSRFIKEYGNLKTKYYILESFTLTDYTISFCLGLSPNWRY